MKKWFLLIAVFSLVFSACDTPVGNNSVNPVVENPIAEDPYYSNDTRLTAFGDAESSVWIRYPTKARNSIRYNIADGDPAAALCTEPGWAYMFYDDQAVIGYEPFPDRVDVMHNAVKITVESHNLEKPNEEWGYINVPMPGPPPPVTDFDPILGKWQFALCNDLGEIVDGPYTAEFEFNWIIFKESSAWYCLESYNLSHDPDAHIVWGTDE